MAPLLLPLVKQCFKCDEFKPLSEFYKHSQMGDGHLNKCKCCTKRDTRENYHRNRDHYLAYEKTRYMLPHRVEARKEYSQTEQGKTAHRRSCLNYRRKYPEKYQAHITTGNAIRDGKLKRRPCEVCGEHIVDAHHDDYGKPLDVTWLCRKHHLEVHGKVAYAA